MGGRMSKEIAEEVGRNSAIALISLKNWVMSFFEKPEPEK